MPLGFYLANVCFTLKVKTFFAHVFPAMISIASPVLFCAVLACLKAEKCFTHCTCAKAVRSGMLRAKQGWSRAGHCLSPGAAFQAPLGKLCACALLCPLCPRGEDAATLPAQHSSHPAHPRRGCDTAEAAGGLHGGKDAGGLHGAERGRCCSTFHSGMPAQTSVLGSLGIADVLWLSFSSELFSLLQKKNVVLQLRRTHFGPEW